MTILGLDIGGANIKAANEIGHAVSRPFAIWKYPEKLTEQIESIRQEFPDTTKFAVTMTAELADCFATKSEGVRFILEQVTACADDAPIVVWTTEGRFVSAEQASYKPTSVAAANWHALATWVGGKLPPPNELQSSHHSSLLIDIGTTTTDFIPIISGVPAPVGLTDVSRLQSGELCYSGVKRTPLCAIAQSVPFRNGYCSLAAELFATTLDVYLMLGEIAEDETDLETANGRPATLAAAHDRIARALCGDRDEVSRDDALHIARFIADVQRQRLAGALERVVQRAQESCRLVIVSGSGSFLARKLVAQNHRLAGADVQCLDDTLSPKIAEAACAFAVAQLAVWRN